jgi:ABC-2 type transport system permease protein
MRTVAKMAWVELKLFGREPINAVFTLAFPFITLFVLGGVFGNAPRSHAGGTLLFRGVGPMDYYAPAYIALVTASIGLVSMPVHLAGYREHGILRRFRASSISEGALVGSQIGVTFAIVVVSAVLITVAAMLAYDIDMPKAIPQLALAFVISTLAFAIIGGSLGLIMPTARAAQGLGLLLFFVMFMLSGAGPPPELLNDPLTIVSRVLPLTYAIRLMQNPWLGFSWDYGATAIVLGFAVVAAGGAFLRLRRD